MVVRVQPISTTLFGMSFYPPDTSRAPGFATQNHAQKRNSNATQSNTQNMEATFGKPISEEVRGMRQGRRLSRPAPRIKTFRCDIVTSQPRIQLTGGYAL